MKVTSHISGSNKPRITRKKAGREGRSKLGSAKEVWKGCKNQKGRRLARNAF